MEFDLFQRLFDPFTTGDLEFDLLVRGQFPWLENGFGVLEGAELFDPIFNVVTVGVVVVGLF